MKILILAMDSTDYQSKSHEIMVAEELTKLGNEIVLVTERLPYGYDKEIPKGIKHLVLPINSNLLQEELDVLINERYDIAFCTSFPGTKYVNQIAKKQGIKSVSQILDVPIFRLRFKHWFDIWKKNVEELENTDVIVCNIPITKELLLSLSENKLSTKEMPIIYYGINTEQADSVPEQQKENYLVWVSGIRWYKNLEIIMFALACMENPPPLKVIGVGDGNEKEISGGIPFRLVQLAYQLGLKVDFLGGVTDIEKYKVIKKAKLGVMGDISESIATMFVLECIYAGTPCITADFPVCRDRYWKTPIYIKEKHDTGEWARCITQCLKEIDFLTQDANNKKEWIKQNRSFSSQAKELNELFERLIK